MAIRDGRAKIACDDAEDMFYLIKKLGFVPNFNISGQDFRSQPPVAALQVELCLPYQTNCEWRIRAYQALEEEYLFWMTFRAFPDGLNHYGNNAMPNQLKDFETGIRPRLPTMPKEMLAASRFTANAIAVHESGWDFTPRWNGRCQDFAPVDLNSLLFCTERVEARLAKELDNGQETKWRDRMKRRLATMRRRMWNNKQGMFQDYDEANGRVSSFITAASFFPLFCGLTSPPKPEAAPKRSPFLKRLTALTQPSPVRATRPISGIVQIRGRRCNGWPFRDCMPTACMRQRSV